MERNLSSWEVAQIFVGIKEVGGPEGYRWVYKPETAIKQIIICHGGAINSLIFICENGDHSPKFGSDDGDKTDRVEISNPVEYLTGISGTIGKCECWVVIESLQFHTNLSAYGPFGTKGGSPFSLSVEDGSDCSLVGFHGRRGRYIDAIGIYARPGSLVLPMPIESNMSSRSDEIIASSSINPGPFGGAFGREWDDGVFTKITRIVMHFDKDSNAIRSVRFQYATGKDGNGSVWSRTHGDPRSFIFAMANITLDDSEEFLTGISGNYSDVEGMTTIRSLSFKTNKRVKGPYGSAGKNYTYFCSPLFPAGKIVGFFGRASSHLHSIGVHMEYQRDEE